MKLIFCPQCLDVRKVYKEKTYCLCGISWAQYWGNGIDISIGGKAIPIGIQNKSFVAALTKRESVKYETNCEFISFVFTDNALTVHYTPEEKVEFKHDIPVENDIKKELSDG